MSLLPNQILPETEPIGTASPSGQVTITHNWYLLLYNLANRALGSPAPAAAATVGVGPSPYLFAAPVAGRVALSGGTVSAVSILRAGVLVETGVTAGVFELSPQDQLSVTYSAIPTMAWLPA